MLDVHGARCSPGESEQVWDVRGRRARPPQPCPSWPAVFLESGPRFPSPSPLPPAAWAPANLLRNHFQRSFFSFPPSRALAPPAPWPGSGPCGHSNTSGQRGGWRPATVALASLRQAWAIHPETSRSTPGTMALCLGASGPTGRPSWASWACRPGLAPPRAVPGGHAAP